MITQKQIRELFEYSPETGLFIRLKSRGNSKKGTIAGTINRTGYIHIKIDGKKYMAHRLAWLYEYGNFPEKHIDHIKTDNRICNLREVSQSENNRNRLTNCNNNSGVTGVDFHTKTNRWRARISVDSKLVHLGLFSTFSEAVDARKNAEILYGYHENHGRDV